MTNREFYTAIAANETLSEEVRNHATEQIAKLDASAEKRKGKISAKEQAKRNENAALAAKVAAEILTTEAMTATDVAAVLSEMLGKEIKVQKASHICRKAVELGLAVQTEVKIPKRGTNKAYTQATDCCAAE